ncbi:GNAT family acetyltransferase [Reinekea sp.]|jgi:ribosomal protein S18 acetylase RimI-like enzyme|uniref:GNAT family acetyltransferase n=1 Tax=Reinekea sp. TaxID=1970455 RepID=UPI002A80195E|nr:GNAT family acetyltransferase [Reinekea sp.]
MPPAYDIRPYQPTDQVQLIDLWQQCGLLVPWNDPAKDIARKLKVNPELFLVVLDGQELIGSVMGGYDGHRGWLNFLAVHPKHQFKGIGRALVLRVEALLRELGCPKLNLQIRSANTQVSAFYRALGYGDDQVIGLGKRLIQDD